MIATLALACLGQVQLMSQPDIDAIQRLLPRVADGERAAQLRDPGMMWYTHREMPPAYQHATGNGYVETTFHSAFYNISGDPSDQGGGFDRQAGGNANREFPWSLAPGGAHNADVRSFKGLLLPRKPDGGVWPVAWFRQDLPSRGQRIVSSGGRLAEGRPSRFNYGWGWVFPRGTVFVEATTMDSPSGHDQVCELRFRIRESDAWGVDMIRPFETAESLAEAIKETWPNWEADSVRRAAVATLEAPPKAQKVRLADTMHHTKMAFDVTAFVEELPPLRPADVSQLFQREWVSCLGGHWREEPPITAPTLSRREFNLLPPNYHLSMLGNDRDGCMRCHESANEHATVFQIPRGWYGRVRGSDGIMSWHPVDPSSVARSGERRDVQMRDRFGRSGVIEAFDPAKHPPEIYSRIKGLH